MIDLIAMLVPVVVLSALSGWALLARPERSLTDLEVLGAYVEYLVMAVGPQLAQAVTGQLLFRRLRLPAWVRGLVMVAVWYVALVVIIWAAVGPTLWAVYIGAFIVVPLQMLTRLAVRLAVRAATARAVSGRWPRNCCAAARLAVR